MEVVIKFTIIDLHLVSTQLTYHNQIENFPFLLILKKSEAENGKTELFHRVQVITPTCLFNVVNLKSTNIVLSSFNEEETFKPYFGVNGVKFLSKSFSCSLLRIRGSTLFKRSCSLNERGQSINTNLISSRWITSFHKFILCS